MKKLFIFIFCLFGMMVMAENYKLALLQPLTVQGTTECNSMEVSMVRGELRKALGWQSNIQVLTRMDVDAMLKEQGFQRSGMVDDSQRKQIGMMTSAQYICVSSLTKHGNQLYIEAYLVDIETGQMTNPATQYVTVENDDYSTLPEACTRLAAEMLGEIAVSPVKPVKSAGVVASKKNFTEDAWDLNMKMIWVEGGDFQMGCMSEQEDCNEDEMNVRNVTLDGFYIGMIEVTQEQWEKVMSTNIYQQQSLTREKHTYGTGSNYPMYFVTWEEAMEFCKVLSNKTGKNYTLPTEAQWEYAARGGKKADGTRYAGSNMIDAVAWYGESIKNGGAAHPCGTKRANALGIYDMSGNVCEWCKDWYEENYASYDTTNPVGPASGSFHIMRGGSWGDDASYCRVMNREPSPLNVCDYSIGFRVVCIP